MANPKRREDCLRDPEKFLRVYFPDLFTMAFAAHHRRIIEAVCYVAEFGGDQAVAAPRGEGKTTLTACLIIFAILRGWVRYPVVVAQTGPHAERIFSDIRHQFERNGLLAADYPEICAPVMALEGAPQRGGQQRHKGERTRIEWKAGHVVFPYVEGSGYGGVVLSYAGLDSAIRGLVVNGQRPDFVLIDDPETRESAVSEYQIGVRERVIDRDIAGLAGPTKRLARVMLCTLQNTYCLAAKYTDRTVKPSWSGHRFGMIRKWPEREDLWREYVSIRRREQIAGDKDARAATRFYLENRDKMEVGAEVANPERYSRGVTRDGWQIERSALQHCYNLIADNGLEPFLCEYQNDPPEESGPDVIGVTAEVVMSRVSGFNHREIPPEASIVTAGIDVGKYMSHWVEIAWFSDASGVVVDYGVIETANVQRKMTATAAEVSIFNSLMQWSSERIQEGRVPDVVAVDAGAFTQTIYNFVRQAGGNPYIACKGENSTNWRGGRPGKNRLVGEHWFSVLQPEGVWLYHLHADYWKQYVHERFLTATFDTQHKRNAGSLSVYSHADKMEHNAYAHHIAAEELREEFKAGKGLRRAWVQTSRNNHWLDATYMACAGACIRGITLGYGEPNVATGATRRSLPRLTMPDGRPYFVKERDGG